MFGIEPLTLVIASVGAAVVLKVLESLSLFSAKEGFRGSGRIGGGLAWICIGAALHGITRAYGLPGIVEIGGIVLAVTGLITAGSGLRKFLRRNTTA